MFTYIPASGGSFKIISSILHISCLIFPCYLGLIKILNIPLLNICTRVILRFNLLVSTCFTLLFTLVIVNSLFLFNAVFCLSCKVVCSLAPTKFSHFL